MKSLGIFAGTFDPIHEGHLEVARLAKTECSLDEVFIAVEQQPWGDKQPVASILHRTSMLDISIERERGISRLELPDKHFSIPTTLPHIERRFEDAQLFFIFGADVFLRMNTSSWPHLDRLFVHHLIIFERGAVDESQILAHAQRLGVQVAILPTSKLHHSSTSARRGSLDLVSDSVRDYITNYKLYS